MSTFTLHAGDRNRAQIVANCLTFVHSLPDSKSWDIGIVPHVKEITPKQRRSIFGPAYKALMEFSGLEGDADKRALHRDMCGEFFGWVDLPLGRKPLRSTTKNELGKHDPMSVAEALRFYAFLQRRGSEVGCYVPDPDPFWREQQRKAA